MANVNVRFELNDGWEDHLDLAPLMDSLGESITEDAKRYAPVDTGTLQESIRYAVQGKGEDIELRVGSDVEYSVYVEVGTSKMSAQPYLRPALETRR